MGKSAVQIVHEAILNDRDLKGLSQMLLNVHNRATKTTVWNPDTKELTHTLNEPYKSEAMELVKLIEHRTEKIKDFYAPHLANEGAISVDEFWIRFKQGK